MSSNISTRIVIDEGYTIYLSKSEGGGVWISIIDDDGKRATEFMLSKRDIEELSNVIHEVDN